MFDASILAMPSQCIHTGLESRLDMGIFNGSVIGLIDRLGTIRFIAINNDGEPISGLLVKPYGIDHRIEGVFTPKCYRRLGYAKQVLAVARVILGRVWHNDNLTDLGKKWVRGIESL